LIALQGSKVVKQGLCFRCPSSCRSACASINWKTTDQKMV